MSNSQFLTFGEVERQFNISKSKISRDRKSGKISADKQPDGSYRVAISELFRVYGDKLKSRNPATGYDNSNLQRLETLDATPEIAVLQAQLDGLQGELDQVRGERDDLRRRLDASDEERRNLTRMLMDQRQQPPEAPQEARGGRLARAWAILRGKG